MIRKLSSSLMLTDRLTFGAFLYKETPRGRVSKVIVLNDRTRVVLVMSTLLIPTECKPLFLCTSCLMHKINWHSCENISAIVPRVFDWPSPVPARCTKQPPHSLHSATLTIKPLLKPRCITKCGATILLTSYSQPGHRQPSATSIYILQGLVGGATVALISGKTVDILSNIKFIIRKKVCNWSNIM